MRKIIIGIILVLSFALAKSQCTSDYIYSVDGNMVYFFDMSSTQAGNISSYYWDFGDGFYSYDQHPIHLFDSLGIYYVCLTIETNLGCSDTYCDSIEIAGCFADFTYVDSLCDYFFYDNSQSSSQIIEYHWDFGDGTISTQQNPVHNFLQNGNYLIKHYITSVDSCTDTIQQIISVQTCNTYFNLSGNVFAGQNNLPNGIVVLINNAGTAIGYSQINQGAYEFDSLNQGNYTLFAIPYFDISQVYFPKYFPTYSGDDSFWQNSQQVLIDTFFVNKNIHLTKNDDVFYGDSKISGYVTYTSTSGFEVGIFSQNLFSKNANSVMNYPVMLLDNSNKILDFALTDFSGNFSFNDLDTGNYIIYLDKYGKTTDNINVSLTSDNPEQKDIHIIIDENQVTDIYKNNKIVSNILIYPVPVDDILNIKTSEKITNIKLKNYLGQTVLNKQINNNNTKININNLSKGLYLLVIELSSNKIITKKITKN